MKHSDPTTQDMLFTMHGHLEIVKFLVEELKCPPDIIGQHNTTPLQMARFMDHSDIAPHTEAQLLLHIKLL